MAIGVSNKSSDAVQLLPMLEHIEANTGQLPDALIEDAVYCSKGNLEECKDRRLNTYNTASRQQHKQPHRPSRSLGMRGLMTAA